jgi:hypothetical protein
VPATVAIAFRQNTKNFQAAINMLDLHSLTGKLTIISFLGGSQLSLRVRLLVNLSLLNPSAQSAFASSHFFGNLAHGFARLIDDADGFCFLLVCE